MGSAKKEYLDDHRQKMMPKVAKQTQGAKHSAFYFCSTFLKMALQKGSSPRSISNSSVSLSTIRHI